ncbi:class I SAM-dependent methyltransferase [Actinomadura litoris]|uniref:class I SAM-dependent methyltransferase n=1 Tax=Actinomadura litoris TaxID=2678616 RepID=UPI001FA6CF10|nr:class I SAM-dependent methyltransferase [Actinomadura litoris]
MTVMSEGEHGTRRAELFDYDAELRLHNEHFRAAARVGPGDRVLDVGCGAGQSTREAARAAVNGSALGIDVSARMLERARRLSDVQGLTNVAYQQADAQAHRFPPAHFDLCVSRFGAMFFADPVAAFTNIGRALRPGARLVLLVWQDRDRNEWASALSQIHATPSAAPFSLADPSTTKGILTAAGFTEVDFTDVHEPVYYGPDTETALDNLLHLAELRDLLTASGAAKTGRARARLHTTLAAHATDDGVYFDSRAWLITARYSPPPRVGLGPLTFAARNPTPP